MPESEKTKINIITTCFNRREKTEKCIRSLLNQNNREGYELNYFVCDDGSTDGTADMLRSLVPEAHIIPGTGSLFWARGMAAALDEAKKYPCDFLLMINDDVEFFPNMLSVMLGAYNMAEKKEAAISGALLDPDTGMRSFGGCVIKSHGWQEIQEAVLPEGGVLKRCDIANWNCFLIQYDYYLRIGDIDRAYEHSYADYDYSQRIRFAGGSIYLAPEYVGYCKSKLNELAGTWQDKSLPAAERLRKLRQPTGLPIKSAVRYWRKYEKRLWPVRVLQPYAGILKDAITGAGRKARE